MAARRWRFLVVMTVVLAGTGVVRAAAAPEWKLLVKPGKSKMLIEAALEGAARRLESARCQEVLTDFADEAGRALLENLAATGKGPVEFLRGLWFTDAAEQDFCVKQSVMAFTQPGSHVVSVCGNRFSDINAIRRGEDREVVLIHEMLHALGLGENGRHPNTFQITRQVVERCASH